MKYSKLTTAAFAVALGLAGGTAYAQSGSQAGGSSGQGAQSGAGGAGQQQGSQSGQAGGFGQGAGGSMGAGQSPSGQQGATGGAGGAEMGAAPIPQYWVTDASIFIGNALHTARGMQHESRLNVQSPQVIGSQAQFLNSAIQRALQDLQALQRNAEATQPTAVGQIREVVAQLAAAQAQTNQVTTAARGGELGPRYQVTVGSALSHLEAAEKALGAVAKVYKAEGFISNVGSAAGGQQQRGGKR